MSYYCNKGKEEFNIGIPYFVYAYVDSIQMRPYQATETELNKIIIKDKINEKDANETFEH